MSLTGVITIGAMAGLFFVLGVLFSTGRGAFLIAGFNTMNKAEKQKYDQTALCKFMGKAMFALGFSTLLWVLSSLTGWGWLFTVGLILYAAVIVFMLVYVNTKNRFKK